MFTIDITFKKDIILAEIKNSLEVVQNDDLEYAFYLYKDDVKVGTRWYSKQPFCMFSLEDDSGFYYVRGFIKDSKDIKPTAIDSDIKIYERPNDLDEKKHIFILMRYSILSNDSARSWKIGQNGVDEYRKVLFSDERLDLHENLFFNLTLHSIDEAVKHSNSNISLIIFISTELPDFRKKKLYDAATERDYLSIKELSPTDKTLISMGDEVFNIVSKYSGKVVYATVRLDDDDALHPQFFKNLEEYVEPAYVGKCVSFSNGYAGLFDGSKFVAFHTMNAINNAQGLASISMKTSNGEIKGLKSIYNSSISHSRTHWKIPVVADGISPMYIRTVHAQGDFYSKDYEKKLSAAKTTANQKVLEDFLLKTKLVY